MTLTATVLQTGPIKPNSLVDQIVWRHPSAKLLLQRPGLPAVKLGPVHFPILVSQAESPTSAPLIKTPELSFLEISPTMKSELGR